MSGGSLGDNARNASFLGRIGKKVKLKPEEKAAQNRLIRWQRQSAAARIMHDQRVAKCYRVRIKPFVEVLHSPKVHKAHYGGLATCASVWMCPICAAKITERKRLELESVDSSGLSRFMVTPTLQHARGERLKTINDHLRDAWGLMKSGRWWKDFKRDLLIIASVTGTEVTYGLDAGWHPHKHALFWSRLPNHQIDVEAIENHFSKRYEYILAKMGRYASPIHGLKVTTDEHRIQEYIAKYGREPKDSDWSLSAEITKGPVKVAMTAGEHYTPFQLLDLYLGGNKQAGRLFREYSITMKGAHQIVWGPHARALFGLGEEASDEEIAAAQEEDAVILALLQPEHWRVILKKEKRAALLEVAGTGNIEYLKVFLKGLGVEL